MNNLNPDAAAKSTKPQKMFRLAFVICGTVLIIATAYWSILSALVSIVALMVFTFTFIASMKRLELKTLMTAVTIICIGLSIYTSQWPLKMRFAISKPALERAVAIAHSGKTPESNAWYGLCQPWRIKTSSSSDQVSFDSSFFRGNFLGFVYTSNPKGVHGLNKDMEIAVADNWYFVLGD